jgi:Zn-dependent peptidase ImmA (M78 family)
MIEEHQVSVLGRLYRIEYVAFEEGNYGECQGEKGLIRIREGLPEEERRATIVHELLHAILYESGITHILEKDNEHLEEAIVRAIEHGLIRSDVIRDFQERGEHYG